MKNTLYKDIRSIFLILVSSLIQTYSIQAFMTPANFITGGFTGLAMLLNKVLSLGNIQISISFFLLILNFPVALLCAKEISKRFVFLSLLQIVSTSFFLKIFHFSPLFNNVVLDISIGAVINGMMIVIALKSGGSTGGTDFIALYISNKINKTIWGYIFVFNMIIIIVFGYFFGWDNAGYTILFQFTSTKIIETFYNRYHRMTIQVYTQKGDEIIESYLKKHMHGITKMYGSGGYSKQDISVLFTTVSVYEVDDIVQTIMEVDELAIINVLKTHRFYGNFHLDPI